MAAKRLSGNQVGLLKTSRVEACGPWWQYVQWRASCWASKWLAKALDPASTELPEFVRSMMFLNRFIANLYTTMNIAFMEPAYERDKQSATENVKGLKRAPLVQYVPVAGKLLGMVTRYIPESYSRSLPRWLLNDSHLEWYEAQGSAGC